jgi:hypothetical protein
VCECVGLTVANSPETRPTFVVSYQPTRPDVAKPGPFTPHSRGSARRSRPTAPYIPTWHPSPIYPDRSLYTHISIYPDQLTSLFLCRRACITRRRPSVCRHFPLLTMQRDAEIAQKVEELTRQLDEKTQIADDDAADLSTANDRIRSVALEAQRQVQVLWPAVPTRTFALYIPPSPLATHPPSLPYTPTAAPRYIPAATPCDVSTSTHAVAPQSLPYIPLRQPCDVHGEQQVVRLSLLTVRPGWISGLL